MSALPPRYGLGQASLRRLVTCDERIQRIVEQAIAASPVDFSVLEGHRSLRRQQDLYAQGSSKCDGVRRKSKHQSEPSTAVDLVPYPIDWQDRERFCVLAGVVKAIAHQHGVNLIWGNDWDDDGDFREHRFQDLPHFEIRE